MEAIIERKPIRPTEARFANRVAEQKFFEYVNRSEKTNSVSMNKIREMVKNHREDKR